MKILVINGPNLNLLGKREPHIYGTRTLNDIASDLDISAKDAGVELEHFQSNAESDLIEKIHSAFTSDPTQLKYSGIIINPAAFTHTSVALRDAISAVNLPFIEVHLSNVHAREAFRHHSYFSDIALGTIVGLGEQGYHFALQALVVHLKNT